MDAFYAEHVRYPVYNGQDDKLITCPVNKVSNEEIKLEICLDRDFGFSKANLNSSPSKDILVDYIQSIQLELSQSPPIIAATMTTLIQLGNSIHNTPGCENLVLPVSIDSIQNSFRLGTFFPHMANEVMARYVVFLRENSDEESRNELNTDWDHVSTSIFNNDVHSFAYKMGVVIKNVDRLIYDSGNKYVQSLVDEATTGGIGYFQSKFQVLCVWFIF